MARLAVIAVGAIGVSAYLFARSRTTATAGSSGDPVAPYGSEEGGGFVSGESEPSPYTVPVLSTETGGFMDDLVSDYFPEDWTEEGEDITVSFGTITHDPLTWPAGDRIWDVCRAIAKAEGANVLGSNPDRLNNPGDISDWADTYGYEDHSGSRVTKFPSKELGWTKLYSKLDNIFAGRSRTYPPTITWVQFAQKYAGNWQSWVANVTRELHVSSDRPILEYINA